MSKFKRLRSRANLLKSESKLIKIKTEYGFTGFAKILTFAIAVVLQLALLLFLYFQLITVFQWYTVVSFILSIVTCIRVLSTDKSGQSKAVWIIVLFLGSGVGVLFYVISDEKLIFFKHKKRYKTIFSETEKYKPRSADCTECAQEVKNDVEYLNQACNLPAFKNTHIKYYPSGASFFDDVLLELNSAEKFVFIEFFIINDGVLLKRTLDVLSKKAARGVDVRIIYDDVGSRALPEKVKKLIQSYGIKLVPFNRLLLRLNVALNYRDHRKIVVIDGKTAFTGGLNLADEYINEKRTYGYWKDTGVRLKGAAVDGICHIFLRQWQFLSGKSEDYSQYLNFYENFDCSSLVVPYADGIDFSQPVGRNVYINMIAGAKKKLYIMTPYFVVDEAITSLLAVKASSGVDVRLIIPGIADKPYVYKITRNDAEKLISSGIKLYCMNHSFVHAKVMLTENAVTVGSVNLDYRSFYQQFEVGVYTNDAQTMASVEEDFNRTFEDSKLINEDSLQRKNFLNRLLSGILQIFSPLM